MYCVYCIVSSEYNKRSRINLKWLLQFDLLTFTKFKFHEVHHFSLI